MKAIIALTAVTIGVSGCATKESVKAAPPSTEAAVQGPPCAPGGRCGTGGPSGPRGPQGIGAHSGCPREGGPLTDTARAAVVRALADERDVDAKYVAIERSLGPTMPFRQIERAERRHAWALEQLLVAHGAAVPAAPSSEGPRVATLSEACAIGVRSEKDNIALYDELMKGDLPADVRCVFGHLQAASRERHLPAFERCVSAP